MKNMRRWQLDSTNAFSLQLAADARLSSTDYTDDQVWELLPGQVESPALALQTQYGERVGLASLVPMWIHDGRTIYLTQTYARPPQITAFAPAYIRAQANILPILDMQVEYWAMESHAIGARFTLQNQGDSPISIRLDLFGHVGAQGQEQPLGIITLKDKSNALSMGEIGNLNPVVLLEKGQAVVRDSPRIGQSIQIESGKKAVVRWVHAGLPDMRDSLALAAFWLEQNWQTHFQQINLAATAIPNFQTGNTDWDAAIAATSQHLLQAFLKPTATLPYTSFVTHRQPQSGYSHRGDGSDHNRNWNGQEPTLAYLVGLAVASIDANLAQGIIRNYVAIQGEDGWIDRKPGLAGQRQGLMCTPLLARLVWGIYQYTEDNAFLAEVFPSLLKYFERWFQDDLDTDSDSFPEWQHERQTGYVFIPTFASAQGWAQNTDIRSVETPDLAAYLLSEAASLRKIAEPIGNKASLKRLEKRIKTLQNVLADLWKDDRYYYRDRDTHRTTPGVVVLDNGRGDEEHLLALPLDPPNRVIVRVIGGARHTPRITLRIDGLDLQGNPVGETVDSPAFIWQSGRGVYTSQQVYSQVDRLACEGLSRVYHLQVETVDTTRLDINAILPLWTGMIPQEQADKLVELITSRRHFWRPNGVTMTSAQDSAFDPANADGSGGVWPFWLTLIGEGLLDYGYGAEAANLVKRLLKVQTTVLKQHKRFFEFYDSDEAKGHGERGHLAGIIPLHLLMRVIGVRVVSSEKVWTGGPFVWGRTVTMRQYGVAIRRAKSGTRVKFPSGYTKELAADVEWQAVIDPNPVSPIAPRPLNVEPPQPKSARGSPRSVMIDVQYDE
jgi:hypothetical protein